MKDIWSIAKVQHVCHFTIAIGFQSVFCNATVYFVSPFSGMDKKKKLFTGRRKKEKVCTLELTENIVYFFFFLINTSLMKFRSSLCWALWSLVVFDPDDDPTQNNVTWFFNGRFSED